MLRGTAIWRRLAAVCSASLLAVSVGYSFGDTTQSANFNVDENGEACLAIPGSSPQFDVHSAAGMFNGTLDNQLVLGYNVAPNGASYDYSEPQVRLALEANYNDGVHHYMEWNLDTVTSDHLHNRRWMYLKVNRDAAQPLTADWAFWGKIWSLQDYLSATNDIPSEYFSVADVGIAQLRSSAGKPAQFYLNTVDTITSPGAYASVVLQRGSRNKWVLTNQGANGDRLSLLSALRETAAFTQNGVIMTAGQRAATRTTTANYVLQPSDSEVRADCSAGSVVLTLPKANGTGQFYRIIKVDPSKAVVTLLCSAGDLIDGQSSVTLPRQFDGVTVVDGAALSWERY